MFLSNFQLPTSNFFVGSVDFLMSFHHRAQRESLVDPPMGRGSDRLRPRGITQQRGDVLRPPPSPTPSRAPPACA